MTRAVSRGLLEAAMRQAEELAGELNSGLIDAGSWQIRMRELLREWYGLQLIAGAGGDASKVSNKDWLEMGRELRTQYRFLERFARDIREGKVSPKQLVFRAKMYAQSSKRMHNYKTSPIDLPAYPGDGSTDCIVYCRCRWEIKPVRNNDGVIIAYDCFWRLGKAEHCKDCLSRSKRWSPLRIFVVRRRAA
jgi:hypothetical protein